VIENELFLRSLLVGGNLMEVDRPNPTEPVRIEPDLEFIRALESQGGETLKKCFQCGTCSATCTLSPDEDPFPRKEIIWAVWGMKDRLLKDPDVWLCYQCHDCSTRCPRAAQPGNVLAAVRQECVHHYSIPGFFGRWVGQPSCLPFLLGLPAALLTAALFARKPIEDALGFSADVGERIVYAYSAVFPHWLLNGFFGFFTLLAFLVVLIGITRFWRAMKSGAVEDGTYAPTKGILPSIGATLKKIVTHADFAECEASRSRSFAHLCVFFGFGGLTLVTLWVITAKHNPLVQENFAYPFGFLSPWKILANLGGVAVVTGCLLMAWNRIKSDENVGPGGYSDWALLAALILVVFTGFATEIMHYQRLEPHRHIAYFVHLVLVFSVLIYLPYSKLAHVAYRTTAMVFAEHTGRTRKTDPPPVVAPGADQEERNDAGNKSEE